MVSVSPFSPQIAFSASKRCKKTFSLPKLYHCRNGWGEKRKCFHCSKWGIEPTLGALKDPRNWIFFSSFSFFESLSANLTHFSLGRPAARTNLLKPFNAYRSNETCTFSFKNLYLIRLNVVFQSFLLKRLSRGSHERRRLSHDDKSMLLSENDH